MVFNPNRIVLWSLIYICFLQRTTSLPQGGSIPGFLALSFGQPQQLPGESDEGPSLATFQGSVWAVWKGSNGDSRIWYSNQFQANSWSQPQILPSVFTSARPALSSYTHNGNQLLYAAWKGEGDDERIWYSIFDGESWSAQQTIPNVYTSTGLALAAYGTVLYAAWKGSQNDTRLWYATYDTSWSPQTQFPDPIRSSAGPCLSSAGFAAWRGVGSDENVYWAKILGNQWSAQTSMPSAIQTSGTPSIVADGGIYAMGKGPDGNESIWYTMYENVGLQNPNNFGHIDGSSAVQVVLPPSFSTSVGPSMAVNDIFEIIFAWKGSGDDVRMWWALAVNELS
jgi:hypothetical protein